MTDLEKQFAAALGTKKKPVKKKKPPKKEKEIIIVPPEVDFNREMKKVFDDEPENTPEFDELYEESSKAKLKQEILKAEQLEYKNEREKLKMMQEAKELIKFDMAEFLFFGFMEKTNHEILRLLRKIEPVVKDLCQENQPMELIVRLTHDLEAIIKDIKKQQSQTVKKWKKES